MKRALISTDPRRATKAMWPQVLEQMGGREGLRTLALVPARSAAQDKRRQRLVALLDDPGTQELSLLKVCEMAEIGTAEMAALMRDSDAGLGKLVAQHMVQRSLPEAVADVIAKAADGTTPCPCTYTPEGPTAPPFPGCRTCMGRGFVFREADLERQKMLLQMGGLIEKGGGVTVNNKTEVAVGLGGNFFESFVRATDASALEVIDATPVDPETDR